MKSRLLMIHSFFCGNFLLFTESHTNTHFDLLQNNEEAICHFLSDRTMYVVHSVLLGVVFYNSTVDFFVLFIE